MTNPLEFYFDFSSPYGYLGSTRITALAARHGRTVTWKPILLGAVFKVTGTGPLPSIPLKGEYSKHDMARLARLWQVPFKMPSRFPIPSQAPARIVYWLESQRPEKQEAAILALYHAYFVEDHDISAPETAAEVVSSLAVDRDSLLTATQDPQMKERLKNEVDAAIHKGVFGSPFVMVDGEPFWGTDHFDQVERWLETGGW